MQFFKIAAYVQIVRLYGLVHYAACVFCSYINCLCFALVGVAGQDVYAVLVCVGVERVRARVFFDGFVFISVDVKYIIHYKRMCKFICSL